MPGDFPPTGFPLLHPCSASRGFFPESTRPPLRGAPVRPVGTVRTASLGASRRLRVVRVVKRKMSDPTRPHVNKPGTSMGVFRRYIRQVTLPNGQVTLDASDVVSRAW